MRFIVFLLSFVVLFTSSACFSKRKDGNKGLNKHEMVDKFGQTQTFYSSEQTATMPLDSILTYRVWQEDDKVYEYDASLSVTKKVKQLEETIFQQQADIIFMETQLLYQLEDAMARKAQKSGGFIVSFVLPNNTNLGLTVSAKGVTFATPKYSEGEDNEFDIHKGFDALVTEYDIKPSYIYKQLSSQYLNYSYLFPIEEEEIE